MLRHALIFGFCMLIPAFNSPAQSDYSYKNTFYSNDSARVQLLIDLANECRYNAPDELMRYNREALHIAENSSFTVGEGLALKGIGSYFYDRAEYDSAMYYFRRAELIFSNIGDDRLLTEILGNFCYACVALGEYNNAFETALRILEITEAGNNAASKQNAFIIIGFIYYSIGLPEVALQYYRQANNMANRRNDHEGIATSKSRMALVFDGMGNKSRADSLFTEAAEILQNMDSPQFLILILFNQAEAYRCRGRMNEAMKKYVEAYSIASERYDQVGKIMLLTRIVSAYLHQLKNEYNANRLDSLVLLTGYRNIDELLATTITGLKNSNNKNDLVFFYQSRIALNKMRGNYQNAFYDNKNLIALKDTVAKINKGLAASKLTFQNEIEQNQKELTLLELKSAANKEKIEIQRQQLTIFIIFLILLILFVLGIWSRIVTIKRLKNKILVSNEQLNAEKKRAERGEQFKERFLANLSHEIRTPMNAIIGITNLLINNRHYDHQKEQLNALNISSRHLLVLINDILDLSKLEAGKFEIEKTSFGIQNIFKKVKSELEGEAEKKGLNLAFTLHAGTPETVVGDAQMLRQILLNLCRSAIEYSDKGEIKVDAVCKEKTSDLTVIQFTLNDQREGPETALRDEVFRSFTSTLEYDKQNFDQSGLGLLIVKQMLLIQGGNIHVSSKEGKGSVFTFEIPYTVDDEAKPQNDHAVSEEISLNGLSGVKILLVEDNEFNVMVAKDQLEDAIGDVQIDVARDGKEALQIIGRDDFDVVLMDIQMPVMNGYETSEAIRKLAGEKGKVPIIAMTANNMKIEVEKCFGAGMNDYVFKPFDTDLLISKIRTIINRDN